LGALSAVFLSVHLLALWADSYVHFGLAELFIPGKSHWNTEAVAWGVVAMYLITAIEATSFLMHKIPRKAWRYVHFNALAVYVLATVHAVRGGTDRTNPIFRWSAFASVQLVLFLLVVRILITRRLKRALREQGGGSVDDRRADRLEALKPRAEATRDGRSQPAAEPEPVGAEPTQVG